MAALERVYSGSARCLCDDIFISVKASASSEPVIPLDRCEVECVDPARVPDGDQQASQHPSPSQLSRPSLTAIAAMTMAAAGSAHHHPRAAFETRPDEHDEHGHRSHAGHTDAIKENADAKRLCSTSPFDHCSARASLTPKAEAAG